MTEKATERISPKEKIGYGLGDTASNIVFQSVMMYLAFFYTDIFGISAAATVSYTHLTLPTMSVV